MTDDKTGGPAFPLVAQNWHKTGMTLRDYFAAQAMLGFISAKAWHPTFVYPDDYAFVPGQRADETVADCAYQYADAMLAQRSKASK